MTEQRINPVLLPADVEATLEPFGFGTARARAGAVILAVGEPPRVIWANRAATLLFDSANPDELSAQIFSGRGREGLGASLKRREDDGNPRTERLRVIEGVRSRTVAMLVARVRLADGRRVIAVAAPPLGGAAGEDPDFAVSVLDAPSVVDGPPQGATGPDVETAPESHALASVQPEAAPDPVPVDPTAALRTRLAGIGSARLVWQTDPDGRVVKLSQGVPDLSGVDDPAAIGQPFVMIMGAGDASPLAEALSRRSPWSHVQVVWPVAASDLGVLVSLSAVPVASRGGFGGFRGFGVADLGRLLDRPRPPQPDAVADEPVDSGGAAPLVDVPPLHDAMPLDDGPADEPLVAESPAAEPPEQDNEPQSDNKAPEPPVPADAALVTPTADTDGREAKDAEAADPVVPPATSDQPRDADPAKPKAADEDAPVRDLSSKVVVLRPYQAFGVFGPLITTASSAAGPTEQSLPPVPAGQNLSFDERSNFDAIARTLRGDTPASEASGTMASANGDAVVETLAVALLVVAGDRVLHLNPAFAALTGFATPEALREAGGLSHLLSGLDPRGVLDAEADRAVPVIDAKGDVVAMEGRLQPIAWDGEMADLVSLRVAPDRLARVQSLERELKHSDTALTGFRRLLDRVSDAVLTVDRQGRLLTLNAVAERLFGHDQNGIAGERLAALVGVEAASAVLREPSRVDRMEVTGTHAGGARLPLRMAWSPLDAETVGVTLDDGGERTSLEGELTATRDRLDQALADMPDLLAKISHELRTPLNGILGFAEVILDERFGPIGNDRYKTYLADIHQSGTHVLNLLSDLLDLSKTQAGRMPMHPAAIDVNRVIGECVTTMQTLAHRERVIVRLSLLPQLAEALVDERAFRQIMGSILSNAIAFNEPGGQVIVSTAMTEGDAVAVRVRDTGIGMSDADIAMALEPFRQIKTTKAGSGVGSGLGLPLARALVEANGATMSIKSQKDEGTLVEIVLPASPAERLRVPAE